MPNFNSQFLIELPLHRQNVLDKLQTLLDSYFVKRDRITCRNEGCNQQLNRTTQESIVEPESAMVVNINRQFNNPMWTRVPENQRNLYPAVKDNRRVSLPNTVEVPKSGGGSITYEVTAGIEHNGEHTGGGHFIAHLKYNGEWFTANDAEPLKKSASYRDYHPELSAIILLRKLN